MAIRYYLESSPDNKIWKQTIFGFSSKKEAIKWFDDEYTRNGDWQVGFFLRNLDGIFFRLVDNQGKEVKITRKVR